MGVWNWRKKNDDVILDCYTYNPYVYNFAKINYGYHFLPEWWKKTPKNKGSGHDTIKNCPAIVEYYKKSIVIPMWCEFEMVIEPKGNDNLFSWTSAQKDFRIEQHPQEQFQGFAKQDGHDVKILSPWFIKCKESIDFTFTQPVWSQRDNIFNLVLMPGVVNYKYQMQSNFNFFFQQTDTRQVIHIEPLTPIAILHPMSERKIKLRHHLLTSKDENETTGSLAHGTNGLFFMRGVYKKKRDIFKKIDEIDGGTYK